MLFDARSHCLLRGLEPDQYRFVFATREDSDMPAEFVSFLSPRDGGKTWGALSYGLWCIQQPSLKQTKVRYFGPTRDAAQDTAWPTIEMLASKYELEDRIELVRGPMEVRCKETGSALRCYGADADHLHARRRGPHDTCLIICDECQDWISDLESFVDRVLIPTLVDDGRLFLLGTPGDRENTYFHKVTTGLVGSFTPITGTFLGNSHSRERVKKRINLAKMANPDVEQEPWFQREYYGKWVADNRKTIYKITPSLNYITEIDWSRYPYHILGVDWGFVDPTARVRAVANAFELVFLGAEERTEEMLSDHIRAFNQWMADLLGQNFYIVADPGGEAKSLQEELIRIHGIPIQLANKSDKFTAIESFNRDASLSRIRVYNDDDPAAPEESPVAKSMNSLVWLFNRMGIRSEGRPRHINDASLYIHRFWKDNLASSEYIDHTPPDTRTLIQREEAAMLAERERQARSESMPRWERARRR